MDKTAGERELEARLAELRAERRAIDAQIRDAQAGLRVLRGRSSDARSSLSDRIVELLQDGPMNRKELAERLDEHDPDKVSRMLTYLASKDGRPIQKAAGEGNLWEIRPS